MNRSLIMAAGQGDIEMVRSLLPASKEECTIALEEAAESGHLECVQELLPLSTMLLFAIDNAIRYGHLSCVQHIFPHCSKEECDKALELAAAHNQVDILKHLLQFVSHVPIKALEYAMDKGHKECIELLHPVINTSDWNDRYLAQMAFKGLVDCVKLFLPISDPKHNNSAAIRGAVLAGEIECVRLLLPLSDVKAKNSSCLLIACLHENEDIFDLLYPHSDAYEVLEQMNQRHEVCLMLNERIKIDEERDALNGEVGNKGNNNIKRKM